MQTVLLACWLVGQGSWASEVPPPPPLPVVVEADSGEGSIDEWVWSVADSWDQRWKRAYAERAAVQPFDGRGSAEEEAPPLEPATAASVELWARFNQPVLRYRVRFTRYLYEPISGVETRADGELFWDQTSARLDLNPPAKLPKPGVNPARKDRSGQPYTVVGARRASYVVRGESVVVANHEEKTFVRHQEPPRNAQNTWRTRFPAISPFLEFDPADRQRTFAIAPGGARRNRRTHPPEAPRPVGRLAAELRSGRDPARPEDGASAGDEDRRRAGGPDGLCLSGGPARRSRGGLEGRSLSARPEGLCRCHSAHSALSIGTGMAQ